MLSIVICTILVVVMIVLVFGPALGSIYTDTFEFMCRRNSQKRARKENTRSRREDK